MSDFRINKSHTVRPQATAYSGAQKPDLYGSSDKVLHAPNVGSKSLTKRGSPKTPVDLTNVPVSKIISEPTLSRPNLSSGVLIPHIDGPVPSALSKENILNELQLSVAEEIQGRDDLILPRAFSGQSNSAANREA